MGETKPLLIVGGCCCCSVIITLAVLLGVSFATLDSTEMGLDYNTVGMTINQDKLFENGRHMIGPGHKFVVFDKAQKTIKFPDAGEAVLESRTQDGLVVDLEVAFQYRLKSDLTAILDIYYKYGEEYETLYKLIARNVLRDVAAEWTAVQFFFNRTDIEQAFQAALSNELESVGAIVDNLQLLDINLPNAFESALQQAEAARQGIATAKLDVETTKVNAQQRRDRVDQESRVIMNQKESESAAVVSALQGTKAIFEANMNAEIASYKELKAQTGLSDSQMINYMWLQNVGSMGAKSSTAIRNSKPLQLYCVANPSDTTKCGP